MQYSRHANIADELTRAVNTPGQIGSRDGLAHDFVISWFFKRGLALDLQGIAQLLIPLHLGVEIFTPNQILITHGLIGIFQALHHAQIHRQV